ncbi:MAG: RdgB/HAM1 family non-canonical purine NTP pyrophosphatase [Planctomycetota bacterium]
MRVLWLASGNAGKRAELERLLGPLGIALKTPKDLGVPFAPVEDRQDFAGNARVKAVEFARLAGGVALADDSGLCVDALGGRPGVHSARYGGEGLGDRQRLERLLRELRDVPDDKRGAFFACCLCLAGPDGSIRAEIEGRCSGLLLREPRGRGGFGYDPIFVARASLSRPPARTFAELDPEEKDLLSHRGQALRELVRRIAADQTLLDP